MRIYTKTGDKGMTRLVGGAAVAKDSDRVESYGTIDELNSWIGYIISQLGGIFVQERQELEVIQNFLFDVGTDLATPVSLGKPSLLQPGAVAWLEERIDAYTDMTPDISRFILPGGSEVSALLHVARSMARRAERRMVRLNTMTPLQDGLIRFVNRLSDYLYALARYCNHKAGRCDVFYERSAEVFHKIKEKGL